MHVSNLQLSPLARVVPQVWILRGACPLTVATKSVYIKLIVFNHSDFFLFEQTQTFFPLTKAGNWVSQMCCTSIHGRSCIKLESGCYFLCCSGLWMRSESSLWSIQYKQTTCWFHLGQAPMVYIHDDNSSYTIYKS